MPSSNKQTNDETLMLRAIVKIFQIQCGACWSLSDSSAVNEACASEDFYERGWRPLKMPIGYVVVRCPDCLRKGEQV
jgi:hypothetical protein